MRRRFGQWEAAQSIGMSTAQAYRYIILPQSIRFMLPPMTGEAVHLVKNSAIVSVIAVAELTTIGRNIISDTYMSFEIWFTVALVYHGCHTDAFHVVDATGAQICRTTMTVPMVGNCPRRKPSRSEQKNLTRRMPGAGLGLTLLAATTLPALAQSTQQSLSSESVIEKIKKRGAIKIGLSLFVPWSMRDIERRADRLRARRGPQARRGHGGRCRVRPDRLGRHHSCPRRRQVRRHHFGHVDHAAAQPDDQLQRPLCLFGPEILANKKLAEGFTEEDFNSPDVTFAERRGATPVPVVAKLFPEAKLLLFDEDGAANQEVVNGNATTRDCLGARRRQSMSRELSGRALHPLRPSFISRPVRRFALRKGDPDALNYFNNWIAMHWRDGFLKERNDYWFGTLDWRSQVAAE